MRGWGGGNTLDLLVASHRNPILIRVCESFLTVDPDEEGRVCARCFHTCPCRTGTKPNGQYVSHIIETDRVSVRSQVGLCWPCLYCLARAHLSAAMRGGGGNPSPCACDHVIMAWSHCSTFQKYATLGRGARVAVTPS